MRNHKEPKYWTNLYVVLVLDTLLWTSITNLLEGGGGSVVLIFQ